MHEGGGNRLKYLERGGDTKILKRGVASWVKRWAPQKGGAAETPYELCITSFYFLRIIDYGIE